MTRRFTRLLWQLLAFLIFVPILLFLADTRYDVLPASIHNHLTSHHAGTVITDVTIQFCSSVNPLSTCQLDADVWHRIHKDLFLGSGWVKSAWMHVKRKREEELTADDKVVMDVRIGSLDPSVSDSKQHSAKWESRPGGLWILRSSARHDTESERAVTALEILFGADAVDPRPGWTLAATPMLIDTGSKSHQPRLSVRHGAPKIDKKEHVLRVKKDGRFKILQISDAHLSTGVGKCRDAIGEGNKPSVNCEADPRTMEYLEYILDDEKPDLVVLTGDQVEGPSARDTQTALFKMMAPLIERNIPYAAIFGNHDDEGEHSLTREAQMAIMQTLPLSLSEPGPASVDGVGNYYLEVYGHSPSQNSALTIYMLDSHSLTPDEKHYKGYDWLKPSQIDWFRRTAQSLKKAHQKYSHIHMDLAFIHIPLPEFAQKDSNIVRGGTWKEAVTAPFYNSHFYDALSEEGVIAVGAGHDHVNDYCALRTSKAATEAAAAAAADAKSANDKPTRDEPAPLATKPQAHQHGQAGKPHRGPWMCYAGGSGFGGYAGYNGFHRRVRLWEVDGGAGRLTTWKRVECCGDQTKKKVDEMVIFDGGAIVDDL